MRQPKYKISDLHFVLAASNGKVILTSQVYKSKASLHNGIESIRRNIDLPDAVHREVADDGRYYFNVIALNNKVIGTSQMYKTKFGRWIGIWSVKRNAGKAIVSVVDY